MARSHGYVATYNNGCHCDRCTEAKKLQQRRIREARDRGKLGLMQRVSNGYWWRCPCGVLRSAARGFARMHYQQCPEAKAAA